MQNLRIRRTSTDLDAGLVRQLKDAKRRIVSPTMQLQSETQVKRVSQRSSNSQYSSDSLSNFVVHSLEDSKAEDIVTIDLTGKSPIFDLIVVASGRSQRHVKSIAEHLLRNLKSKKLGSGRVEGLNNCDWVLIDAGDVVVHIFRPEVREFYNLEKLWSVDQMLPSHPLE